MNKYQEALDELSFPLYDSSCGGCKCGTSDCQECEKAQAVFTLQELVEKATPKKPNIEMMVDDYEENGYIKSFLHQKIECPICRTVLEDEADCIDLVGWKHCPTCGQALDWSGEDD